MAFVKKYLIALLVTTLLGSCSHLIRGFGLESAYLQKNKGKEGDLILEVSILNDTLFTNEDTCLEVTAILKYVGLDYYYFKLSPILWRMDGGVANPNAFLRTVYYGNERCYLKEDYIMHNEQRYGNYLLRPRKPMIFEYPLNMKRLYCPCVVQDSVSTKFGEYQMELYYITEFQDTIRSEKVRFWYLEK